MRPVHTLTTSHATLRWAYFICSGSYCWCFWCQCRYCWCCSFLVAVTRLSTTGYASLSPIRSQLDRKQVSTTMFLSKINFPVKSWEYDFTADYYVILGLKVISRQFEILPFNLTFLFQSLCSLWFLNTWSSSLLASSSSSSPTSPLESNCR